MRQIRRQRGVPAGGKREVAQRVVVVPGLHPGPRAVALVRAQQRRKGVGLAPAVKHLAAALDPAEREVAARVGVIILHARHAGAQPAGHPGRQAVVPVPIDDLVAAPIHVHAARRAGVARAVEDEHLVLQAGFLHRLAVELRPQQRIEIMHIAPGAPVEEARLLGHILAVVGHPTADTHIQRVMADDRVFVPVAGSRVGQVQAADLEPRHVVDERLAARVSHQIARITGGVELLAFLVEIWVEVRQPADALIRAPPDFLAQAGVQLLVDFPVPEQALALPEDAHAGPVLGPDAGQFCPGGQHPIDRLAHVRQPALDAKDAARKGPARRLRHDPGALRQPAQQFFQTRAAEEMHARLTQHFQRVALAPGKIQLTETAGFHQAAVAARR